MSNKLTSKLLIRLAVPAALAGILLAGIPASAQEKITLQQAIETMLQNNLQIKQAALSEALSIENISQSQYALYPNLNSSGNLNFSFGRSEDPTTRQFINNSINNNNVSLSSNVALFQGFQRLNQIAQNKYQLDADKSNTRKVKNDLTLLVVSTYLLVLNNRDLLVAAQQQAELSSQQLDRVQKLFNVGNNTIADLSQARSQSATAGLNITNAQNQLDISYLNLAQLMERDPSARFEVVDPTIGEIGVINTNRDASQIYATAEQIYPDIKLAEYNRLFAQKGVSIAKGNYFPRLTMGASVGTGYSSSRFIISPNGPERIPFADQYDQNLNQAVGFTLSVPIFNGFTARSTVRRAKINLQNAEYSEQLTKNTLNKTINQAVLDLRAAEKSYNSALSAYNSQKDAFNATQQRYTVGLVNSLDFNQAQTNLNRAQFDMIQAKYNFIFRNKVIDYYLGNPITF